MNSKTNLTEEIVNVLIVEDSPTQAEHLKYLLEQHSYNVTVAENGRQALEHIGKNTPTLVITDIVMPEMSGYELCQKIKAQKQTSDIPVILLTSLNSTEDVLEGLACGADNFISKPYSEQYLLSNIANILVNTKLRKSEYVRLGMEIQFGGKKRFITADQQQMLSMLISTYEAAVNRNKELIRAQNELKNMNDNLEDMVEKRTAMLNTEIIERKQAEEKYHSIFDNATEGIYQTTPEGQFITANRAMATMLGYDSPEELMSTVTDISGHLYVNPEERSKLKQMIKDRGQVKSFETLFYRKDGKTIWVSVNVIAIYDEEKKKFNYNGIATDISERKKEEKRQVLINKILEALNRSNDILNLISDILLLLKEYTGIEAIGIRLREGEDFPYFETKGFPSNFLEAENYLCSQDKNGEISRDAQGNPYLECMCGNIISGRTDSKFSFFTKGGSFWSNNTTELLASTSGKNRQARTRNRCNSEGYESVVLIPLRSGDTIIGLLQLNDTRRNCFTIETIQFLEGLGATIGIAVNRKQMTEKLKETLASLGKSFGATVQVMVSAIEMRDPYTAGHQLRVANLACAIGAEMGLSQEKLDGINMAGSIHDIGKLSIPAEILVKPTKLTNIEFSLIKEHPQSGYEILKNVESPWPLAEIVYQHHERMNGTGYPRNLKGDEIIIEARIMAVADVMEAMASHRPYRAALGIEVALEEIEKNKGILYDNAVADACLKLFREKDYKLITQK